MDVAASTERWQAGRVVSFEQLLTVFGGLHPQAYAELHVGSHLVCNHPRWSLRGQDQRSAKGSTETSDALELRFVFRVLRDHLGELVDDNEQVREGVRQWVAFLKLRDHLLAVSH